MANECTPPNAFSTKYERDDVTSARIRDTPVIDQELLGVPVVTMLKIDLGSRQTGVYMVDADKVEAHVKYFQLLPWGVPLVLVTKGSLSDNEHQWQDQELFKTKAVEKFIPMEKGDRKSA